MGVDFVGPLYVKKVDGSNCNTWICLYTCFVTWAVHLDLVPDLSTERDLPLGEGFLLEWSWTVGKLSRPLPNWYSPLSAKMMSSTTCHSGSQVGLQLAQGSMMGRNLWEAHQIHQVLPSQDHWASKALLWWAVNCPCRSQSHDKLPTTVLCLHGWFGWATYSLLSADRLSNLEFAWPPLPWGQGRSH